MNAGQKVRLISDPGRVGILTGRTLGRAAITLWQVHFSDGTNYVPEDQLDTLLAARCLPVAPAVEELLERQ